MEHYGQTNERETEQIKQIALYMRAHIKYREANDLKLKQWNWIARCYSTSSFPTTTTAAQAGNYIFKRI